MMIRGKIKSLNSYFRIEDKVARAFKYFPSKERINSYPFLCSDTYYFKADIRIDIEEDLNSISGAGESSVLYLNGKVTDVLLSSLIKELGKRQLRFLRLIVGDSDFPLKESTISELIPFFIEIYSVNFRQESLAMIKNLPLGLESQRYRSAGQIRDFKKLPKYEPSMRPNGILVAWNDDTFTSERKEAREILRLSPSVFEFRDRVPARTIHKMMRKSKLVACPRGNGIDTHRFWESLYLGALPVLLKKNRLTNEPDWPCYEIDSWHQVSSWTASELTDIYESKIKQLKEFRAFAHQFVDHLGGKDV